VGSDCPSIAVRPVSGVNGDARISEGWILDLTAIVGTVSSEIERTSKERY